MLFNNLPINEELIEILDEIPRQLDQIGGRNSLVLRQNMIVMEAHHVVA